MDITPALMIRNEEYWIYYTIRDLMELFPHIIILDTGSDDSTKDIIKQFSNGNIELIEENYGDNADKIGNGRNILREACQTHWMFLIDGDEIWRKENLQKIINADINEGIEVVMVAGWNVQDVNGKLQLRTNDIANRDGLFAPNIKWGKVDYPFEGYRLIEDYIEKNKVQYLPAPEVYAWHVRHTLRSSKNWETFFRKSKMGFYPYNGPFEDMPENWLGGINLDIYNPYLNGHQT